MADTPLPPGYPFTRVPESLTKEGRPSQRLCEQKKRRKTRPHESRKRKKRSSPAMKSRPQTWDKSADTSFIGSYEHVEVQIKETLDKHTD